jgi:hypothetical protein
VSWSGDGTRPAGKDEFGSVFFVYKKILSAVKTAKYVSGSMSYVVRCDIILLNVMPQQTDDMNDI